MKSRSLTKHSATGWLVTFLTVWGLMLTTTYAATTEPYGLDAMAQFERLPFLKVDTMSGGQSSYDRSGANEDFNNFLYSDATGNVMLDLKGPGTVYRIWSTGFEETDTIKVYFDGESTPRINMLLADLFIGTNAPFLSPLVGDNNVSSGGFYCYLPLPFKESIKIVTNGGSDSGRFFYNIGYDRYSLDSSVTTWTGSEDSTPPLNMWNNVGADPKSDTENSIVTNTYSLMAGETQTLLDASGPRSISSIKLKIPGISRVSTPPPTPIVDTGRAFTGHSQFQMALDSSNTGATLVRRFDYGVTNQTANVYVDGALVGTWINPGEHQANHWRDSRFPIPSSFTAGKNSITIKIEFVRSQIDWNEFTYWMHSIVDGTEQLTDMMDVGDLSDSPPSESSHSYEISGATWGWYHTFTYPYPFTEESLETMEILNNLWLRISFDNETDPSIYAPLGSFFGMGQFGVGDVRALPIGIDENDNLYCYFPMPFSTRAVVQLVSQRSTTTADIDFEIRHKPFTNSFTSVGCFKTQFQAETPSTNGTDFILLDAEGSGHFMGVVQSMTGPSARLHLEGDERIYVDDSNTPVVYGTGKEDFYNGGWYFNQGLFTLPLHGYTVNFSDEVGNDYTTAYRLFIADAIPFRKHIRVGIEHGGVNEVQETCTTLAYYYYKPNNRVVLTDQLNVGNTISETAHAYTINSQTWTGPANFQYEGDHDTVSILDEGRAHKGYSQFTMDLLQPTNSGAILRRRFDYFIPDQKASVSVDGALVGTWYHAGSNLSKRWKDDDFIIPATYTTGKNSITIKVQYLSSPFDWNEFNYTLYTLLPANPPLPQFSEAIWQGEAGKSPYQLNYSGVSNVIYSMWGTTNLVQYSSWKKLGTTTEESAGQYQFIDPSATNRPSQFYRLK